MSEVAVLKIFDNELDAAIAQQMLQKAGVTAFVFKDDAWRDGASSSKHKRSSFDCQKAVMPTALTKYFQTLISN
ncbi:MAG TPA: hypothetical protein VIF81_11865 [Pyrinomonadaceae bacterium]|jgi:hypothetical protein